MGSHRVGLDRSLISLLAESSRTVTIFQSPLYPENVVESDHSAPADLGGEAGPPPESGAFPPASGSSNYRRDLSLAIIG